MPLASLHHWRWSQQLNPSFGGDLCGTTTFDRLGATTLRAQIAVDGLPDTDPHSNQTVESQSIVFFPDATTAAAAFEAFAGSAANCQTTGPATGPGLRRTLTAPHAGAWAKYPLAHTESGGGVYLESHIYVVQVGSELSLMTVTNASTDGAADTDYLAVNDQTVLTDMTKHLTAATNTTPGH